MRVSGRMHINIVPLRGIKLNRGASVSAYIYLYIYKSEDVVHLRVSPFKGSEFLLSASCCPWRRRVYPRAGHYANVIMAEWGRDRACMRACVHASAMWCDHRAASHFTQILLVPVALLSALIELTSEEQSLFEESAGMLGQTPPRCGSF